MKKHGLWFYCWKKVPVFTLSGSLFAAAVFLMGEPAFQLLCWKAGAWQQGEGWRLFSGHFVHASPSHLCVDLGAFLLLGSFVELSGRWRFLRVVGLTLALSSLLLEAWGRFSVYCGMSGIAMGMFVAVGFVLIYDGRSKGDGFSLACGLLAFLLAMAKIGWEFFGAQSLFLDGDLGGFQVAVEAHIAGAVAGAMGSLRFPEAGFWRSLQNPRIENRA